MKEIYLIAIAFLASSTVSTASKLPIFFEDECPAVDICPPKLISHESDCSRYYECIGGVKQIRNCAPGLYFSKSWRGCVRREISDCVNLDCVNGEQLPHECMCTAYYKCINGHKARRDCPPGQVFDKSTRNCKVGSCGATTMQKPETLLLCKEGAFMPHECQCDKYYECKNGQIALRECGKGRHFDKRTLICVNGEGCGNMINIKQI
ncbi:peritrophin-48-like [Pogonomyrmex barbatus]|uniref:Peritrophin-48-like n=1 Tax=Pogonomyrmex barbatus TaxID=144034 RepID=A0A6I9WKI3_9HYME|nr:peritrophin-48-like [Pogonomyrmex barbatus]